MLDGRQAPVAAAMGALLPDVLAVAAAIEDNAIEAAMPMDYHAIREWQRQLERINRHLEGALTPPSTTWF